MFRLAHISDLHLSPIPKIRISELMSKRITGYLNWQQHRKAFHKRSILNTVMNEIHHHDIDHLAITGDMVNLATQSEIIQAQEWLTKNCPANTTSLVPGNHDAYVPGAFQRAMTAWKPWITSDEVITKHKFPYMQVRGPIAIIGLSTSNATMPFRATGDFSKRQAQEATKLLIKANKLNLFRIILIHHPPYKGAAHPMKRMLGVKNFEQMIDAAGAELVLHGHTHLNTRYNLKTSQSVLPIIGISSASQSPGDKKPVAGFNTFDISGKKGQWQCKHQRYGLDALGDKAELIETVSF